MNNKYHLKHGLPVVYNKFHRHNHCQTGNIGLSLEVMDNWLESIF